MVYISGRTINSFTWSDQNKQQSKTQHYIIRN